MSLTTPAEDVIGLVRTEDRNHPLRELLNLTPLALLGVNADAKLVLEKLDIKTVFDLATSALFDNATKLVNAASDFKSALFQHGSPTADMIKEAEIAGKKLSELQFMPIRVLEGVPEADADTIATALDVATVRDLALYPPYRAAQQILSAAYFPENEAGYDPETPPDLRPRTGEYPTERVQYATLLMDEIVTVPGMHFTDLQSRDFQPINITRLSEADAGFKEIAFGALLTFNQSWYAQGVTLGQLLHSISLAPGESTRIAVVDWSRKSRAGETEIISETEDLTSDTSRNRSISEVTQAVANEAQGGFSKANTNSISLQSAVSRAGESGGGLWGDVFGGSSGSWGTSNSTAIGVSSADSYSTSSGHRDIGSTMQQNIIDRTQQHAHASRSRRASVVKEVSQSEHENVSTRVLANYNHMHALTIQYYEVVQVYRVEVAIVKADKVIFIPIALVDFTNDDTVRRFRDVLARQALTYEIHDALRNLDVIEITPDEDVHFVPLNNNLKSYTREVVFTSRAVGMARAMNPSEVPGNSDVASSSAASVNMVAPQQRLSVVLPAIQQINEKLWTVEQASHLSSLLGRMTLRPDSTALYLPTDVTLEGAIVSGGDIPLTVVFYKRQGGSVKEVSTSSPLALSDVSRIAISGSSASNDIAATVTLTVNRNGVRFPVDLPAVQIAKGTPGETRVALVSPGGVNSNLKQHLNDNKLYYSQVVYRSLDSTQIALLLSGYALQVDDKMVPVSQLIEPRPIRYVGNYLAFTMNSDPQNDKVWAEWLQIRGIHLGETGEDIIPLPSGGTFAEAVLGRFNCAEQLDITRFWNWQDSPIPLQPTEIAAIQTGSRATQENVTPGQLSSPIVYIQQPTALPDPTGTAAVLSAIQNGNMFRDMSGLQGTIGLAQAALQATAAGATAAGQQAGTNMQNELQAQTERMRIAADLAKSAISTYTGVPMGGGSSGGPGSGRNVSHDGAKVNYFDKKKETARSSTGTSSSGASSVGSSSSGSAGTGTSGLNGTTGTSGSGTSDGNISDGMGYSQNPGILAATWGGDSQPRSDSMGELVNASFDRGGQPNESFDVRYDVQLVPQLTGMSCWAAGAAMLVGWRDNISIDPSEIAAAIGYWQQYKGGLDKEDTTMFKAWGLTPEPVQTYTVAGFRRLLEQYGPLWVASAEPGPHIRVVTGISGDGSPDGTNVYINDPWEKGMATFKMPNKGSQYPETYTAFERKQRALAIEESAGGIYVAHL
jgi:hypothetical protein